MRCIIAVQYIIESISDAWNAGLYRQSCGFVWQYGRDVLSLLEPRFRRRADPRYRLRHGPVTAEIARTGAEVVGIARSPAMIAEAQSSFPGLRFVVQDVCDPAFRDEFDAVFSNAALHWVKRADEAAASMAAALKRGGRLAAELGARGNVAEVERAADQAWESLGVGPVPSHPGSTRASPNMPRCWSVAAWRSPSATVFDRPTPTRGRRQRTARWLNVWWPLAGAARRPPTRGVLPRAAELARPRLCRDGQWHADYRRLRIVARKTEGRPGAS